MKKMEVLVSHAQEETPVKSDTQKSTTKTNNNLQQVEESQEKDSVNSSKKSRKSKVKSK